jgi:3-hydroxyisobutyrate dehydrogenase-like beta-hydroxyacid dehydrogenase
VLSIVPPAQAVPLAERLAPALVRAGGRTVYADCNAIAPETVRRIAKVVAGAGCPFADVGIIGGPPRDDDAGPRLYASGEAAALLEPLAGLGLDLRVIEGGIGAASALKMAYATVTKGLTALGSLAALGASAAGVGAELRAELALSQPALLAYLSRQVPGMVPKAYRWVAEMEEIAAFLRAPSGEAASMLEGAARLYATIARDRAGGGEAEVATIRRFYARPEG